MAENSRIGWTDHTFNPWIGCTKVSAGCDFCYAETQNRFRKWTDDGNWGPTAPRRRTSTQNWNKVRRWNREAAGVSPRPRVFCASLADIFDNHPSIKQVWRDDLWTLIEETQNLDWLLLTKRPQNIRRFIPLRWSAADGLPPNIWLGITAENQQEYNRRWPIVQSIRAHVKFVSYEPALERLDIEQLPGRFPDWIIVGGESGAAARPFELTWLDFVLQKCLTLKVPVFVKQMGNNPLDMGNPADFTGKGTDPAEWSEVHRVQQFPTIEYMPYTP